ncbi:hypothetical protein IV203_008782 [Nitzschia inconspicua]|uniref:Uncharacterized protein n=1 Tax=Nitzschia inconspicua TaxID=303405 RepID=A0A9K3L059_9STRA|nr:hypothetical protein IV203_008782 [Nitzschia inconspicua]
MNAFHAAVAEANRSCSLIEQGEYYEAIVQLTSSLSALKQIMPHASDDGSIKTSLDECIRSRTACSNIDEEVQGQFIYERVIYYNIPTDDEISYRESVLVSCIVIFNLAIAYHLRGDRTSLTKSLKLYELSFNLQKDQQFENNILFTLAIVNNLGLVHRKLNDEQSASKCFDHILSTLMYLTDCGQASEHHLDGFFHNVTGVVSQPTVAAAA